jgi:hypothetical protein
MGAKLHSDGFIDLLDRLEKSVNEVERQAAAALNGEFKKQMAGTKEGPSGRLPSSRYQSTDPSAWARAIRRRATFARAPA